MGDKHLKKELELLRMIEDQQREQKQINELLRKGEWEASFEKKSKALNARRQQMAYDKQHAEEKAEELQRRKETLRNMLDSEMHAYEEDLEAMGLAIYTED